MTDISKEEAAELLHVNETKKKEAAENLAKVKTLEAVNYNLQASINSLRDTQNHIAKLAFSSRWQELHAFLEAAGHTKTSTRKKKR